MKSINGEIALVTGGGGGLGRLLSLRLSNLGAIVVIWDINKAGEYLKSSSRRKRRDSIFSRLVDFVDLFFQEMMSEIQIIETRILICVRN